MFFFIILTELFVDTEIGFSKSRQNLMIAVISATLIAIMYMSSNSGLDDKTPFARNVAAFSLVFTAFWSFLNLAPADTEQKMPGPSMVILFHEHLQPLQISV